MLLGVAILITFSLALALIFSALNVFYRDFQNIVQTIMQFMHFLVPMMYPFARVWDAHESHPMLYQIYVGQPGHPGGPAAAAAVLVPAGRGHQRGSPAAASRPTCSSAG